MQEQKCFVEININGANYEVEVINDFYVSIKDLWEAVGKPSLQKPNKKRQQNNRILLGSLIEKMFETLNVRGGPILKSIYGRGGSIR